MWYVAKQFERTLFALDRLLLLAGRPCSVLWYDDGWDICNRSDAISDHRSFMRSIIIRGERHSLRFVIALQYSGRKTAGSLFKQENRQGPLVDLGAFLFSENAQDIDIPGSKEMVQFTIKSSLSRSSVLSKDWELMKKIVVRDDIDGLKNLVVEKPERLAAVHFNDETLLHKAASMGAHNILLWLLESGANPNAIFSSNITPLHSITCGHKNPKDCDTGICSRCDRCAKCVIHLVRYGAKSYEFDSEEGCTPLHFAAEHGQYAIIDILLKFGSPIDVIDGSGQTAIMLATKSKHHNCIKLLTLNFADYNIRDNSGNNALSYADGTTKEFFCMAL